MKIKQALKKLYSAFRSYCYKFGYKFSVYAAGAYLLYSGLEYAAQFANADNFIPLGISYAGAAGGVSEVFGSKPARIRLKSAFIKISLAVVSYILGALAFGYIQVSHPAIYEMFEKVFLPKTNRIIGGYAVYGSFSTFSELIARKFARSRKNLDSILESSDTAIPGPSGSGSAQLVYNPHLEPYNNNSPLRYQVNNMVL